MLRIFDESNIDSNRRVITMTLSEKSNVCLALFTCIFNRFDLVSFHVESFCPSAFSLPREFDTFYTRALRIVREGLSPDEASLLEI